MNKKMKVLITLTGMTITTLHVINKIQYMTATVKNTLGGSENHYYEWRFGKIRYTKKGNGSPLLLVHDLTLGSSGYEYHRLVDQLAKTHEVYTIDFLGYGLSDKPNMTYTNFLYVQMLTDFVKNVIGRKTDIIASGDSAPITVMTCHNDPEVFNRIVLINPQSIEQLGQIPSKQTKALKLLIESPIVGTFVYNLASTKSAFINLFQNKYFANPGKIKAEYITAYVEASHTPDYNSKYSFASYIGRYTNSNIIHSLKEINHAVLILEGEEKEGSHEIIDTYLSFNSALETAFISGAKQLPHIEEPDQCMQHIGLFLN